MSHSTHRARTARKRLYLHLGVAGSMLVIVGLYAASVPSMFARERGEPTPGLFHQQISEASAEMAERVEELKQAQATLKAALESDRVRAESIDLMKVKLESATNTYEEGLSSAGTHP